MSSSSELGRLDRESPCPVRRLDNEGLFNSFKSALVGLSTVLISLDISWLYNSFELLITVDIDLGLEMDLFLRSKWLESILRN